VTELVGSVGRYSSHFIETEVTSFIQFYGAQLSRALEWNVGEHLSSGSLEELESVMLLFYAIALGVNSRSTADLQAMELLRIFSEKALTLVQHLNYVLSHPNHLVSLFEPIASEERRSLDRELSQATSLTSVLDLLDVEKRPFIASLTQRLHLVVRNILATLVIVNRGDEVIVAEPEDWPTDVQIALVSLLMFVQKFRNLT
jgi:nuclear pore complex protein Nup188